MAWQTPKTDWSTDDGIGTADLNRIEGNIDCLDQTTIAGMEDVGSAANLDITKKMNVITGNTDIKFIKTTGFHIGETIILYFPAAGTYWIHSQESSPPVGYAAIKTTTGADVQISSGSPFLAMINYDGTYWNFMRSY